MNTLRLAESAHKCVYSLHFEIVSSTNEDVKRIAHTTKDKEKLLNRIRER